MKLPVCRFMASSVRVALVGLALCISAAGRPALALGCPETVGAWGHGPVAAIAVGPGHAYVGSGTSLLVLDLSDWGVPAEVADLDMGGLVEGIAVEGAHVFVAAGTAGLRIVDVTSPLVPVEIGALQVRVSAGAVAVSGSFAFVGDRGSGRIHAVDISDPQQPREVGFLDCDGEPTEMVIAEGRLLVAAGTAGLNVIDISSPGGMALVGSLAASDFAWGLAVTGSSVLLADFSAGLRVIDVSDPAAPREVGSLPTSGFTARVAARGTEAFVVDYVEGLVVVDVSVPSHPFRIGSAMTSGMGARVALAGDHVLVGLRTHGLDVWDATSTAHPVRVAFVETGGRAAAVAVQGERAFVAARDAGLRVLDLTASPGPSLLGELRLYDELLDVAVSGSTALVAASFGGVRAIDVSSPAHPYQAGTFTLIGIQAWAVEIQGVYGYVAAFDSGLRILDISDPSDLREVGAVEGIGFARDVAVHGAFAFIADHSTGLRVIDVSSPHLPHEIAVVPVAGEAQGVAVQAGRAYVAAGSTGLAIVDVSDPSSPRLLGSFDTDGEARSVAVIGTYAVIGDGAGGVVVVDVTDPAHPVQAGRQTTPDEAAGVAVAGARAFVARGMAGVEIIDLSGCGMVPPTAAFSWSPQTPRVGEVMQLRDLSSGQPTSWYWELGDGATSTEPSPAYTYASPGRYTVRLTAANDLGNDSTTALIVVRASSGELPPIEQAGQYQYVIPAAAHTEGAGGTQWVSDVVLYSSGGRDAVTNLYLMKDGLDNTFAEARRLPVPAGASVRLEDVVRSTFSETDAAGAILIGSDLPLIVSSRTYNNAQAGTFGQLIPGSPASEWIQGTRAATLIHLTQTPRYRTNLGLVNLRPYGANLIVEVYGADGGKRGEKIYSVPPWGWVQKGYALRDITGSGAQDAFVVVRSQDPTARYVAYASTVDNVSGDAVFGSPVAGSGETLFVAGVAHLEGVNQTVWRTDLELCATGTDPARLRLDLLRADSDNSSPAARSVTVPPSGCSRYDDIVGSLFGSSGSAALRIVPEHGSAAVSSRTYNQLADRTFGQHIPGQVESRAISIGQRATLVQLAHSISPTSGFRTNIGLTNRGAEALTVTIDLHSGDGAMLASRDITLRPFEFHQEGNVFRNVVSADLSDAFAVLSAQGSANGGFFAYASVIDNRSGDPVYIPAVIQ